ncbi:prenyltransferase/squalene oxidase repeat-containing protein [Streptomyces sp. NPDC006285]|uniref:prenyltransferase/squalene oxidase repeat-containing protein n=1 Tax=Streptomyces sp. NPDC006285 TaxID=3364742 RepID=UPI0036CCEDA5
MAVADRWMRDLATHPHARALPTLPTLDGPHGRRALYLRALAVAAGAPGADAGQLLGLTRAALGTDRGRAIKPWQRILLFTFETIACSALNAPLPPENLDAFREEQSEDGSYFAMPLVTGMVHIALRRQAPADSVARRCCDALLSQQQPDGTWRFLISEVWDTGLMARSLRGVPDFETSARSHAQEFLAAAQSEDGGWGCTTRLSSDNDSTGNTLLALAGTPWATRVRTSAGRYTHRRRTPEGLWTTWQSRDDGPAPDVVAHMAAGARVVRVPGLDLTHAERWLAALQTEGCWPSDWYLPPTYSAAEITPVLSDHPRSRHASAQAVIAAQRDDGGWPRIRGEDHSSPTATGLALTALCACPGAAPPGVIEAAVRYLIDTQDGDGTWTDRPLMYGPRPFLTVTAPQVHALTSRGLRDALTCDTTTQNSPPSPRPPAAHP